MQIAKSQVRVSKLSHNSGLPKRLFCNFCSEFSIVSLRDFLCCCVVRADPEWSSASIGLFICIKCSGIHRNLGPQISVVKSLRLDTWTDEKLKVTSKLTDTFAAFTAL